MQGLNVHCSAHICLSWKR